jgi:aspartate/methionine/tyrosine aminotransferase
VPTAPDGQLDLDRIVDAITPRTRAIVTVSPNNPTGAVYAEASLGALSRICGERGLFHIHDEAYEYFVYGEAAHFSPGSIPGAAEHTISLYTLSKTYGMASWRVGYLVCPDALWDAMSKVQDTVIICAAHVSQQAARAALRVGRAHADQPRPELEAARRLVQEVLGQPDVPCDLPPADGAFYVFPRIRTALSSMALAERLVREHRVAVVPGAAFGDDRQCPVRVSYGALDRETLREGLDRLAAGLRALAGGLAICCAWAGWIAS